MAWWCAGHSQVRFTGRVALGQCGNQRFPDACKLLHVLVPVHMVRWRFPLGFKGVELALNHHARCRLAETAQNRLEHGLGQ